VLLLCAGFGASMTAVSVSTDMTGGIIDRFRSLDVAGASVLAGHVTASMARNLVSTVLVFAVAFVIGFRPGAWPSWSPRWPSPASCSVAARRDQNLQAPTQGAADGKDRGNRVRSLDGQAPVRRHQAPAAGRLHDRR
jgi:hypothetical protein